MSLHLPYARINAFTSKPFSGNPAAIVRFPFERKWEITDAKLGLIAKEFNLPMTAFLASQEDKSRYGLRWFTPHGEVPLCGHATLGAAGVLLANEEEDAEVKFDTLAGVLSARKIRDGCIEMSFPAGMTEGVPAHVEEEIGRVMSDAIGGGTDKAEIVSLRRGVGKTFEDRLVVEIRLEEDTELGSLEVNVDILNSLANKGLFGFGITVASKRSDVHFESRVFHGYGEDAVTGSMHCLLGPYWRSKLGLADGAEMHALQVSPRGGEMQVVWHEQEGICSLRGQCTVLGHGILLA